MSSVWKTVAWVGALALAGVAAAPAAAASAVPSASPPPPLESFFSEAALRGALLSPSGRWLGMRLARPGRRVGLQIVDLQGSEPPRVIEASDTDDIAWFQWFDDEWLLFSLRDAMPQPGIWRGPGLMSTRRDGSQSLQLLDRGFQPGALLALGAPGSKEVMAGFPRYDARGELEYTALRAVDITSGKDRKVYQDEPRASDWWFDGQGRPRLISRETDTEIVYLWAEARGDATGRRSEDWREIARMPLLRPAWAPAYIEGEDKLYVVTLDAQGYTELRRFDFDSGRPAAPALLSTPGFDSGVAVRREVRGGPPIGVDLDLDAHTTEWFTPVMKDLQARIDARWPGRVNVLQCRPCDAPRAVMVFSYADTDPGRFLLYRPQEDRWLLLGAVRPDIDPQRMAHVEFHRIRARDGRDLPVWVTRHTPAPGAPPPPAVVLVHGGPNLRGVTWDWNPEAQFLASRGYVVIEPEFRGSTGYGDQHFRAGWKEWGGAMIDDITDAYRYAAAQGWADGRRACIMGSSYGGYATLMSLAKEPALYRCGIAHAALSDPRHRFDMHWSDLSRQGRRVGLPATMGDPDKDAELLAAHSPLAQVSRIQAPLLMAHGHDDQRVPSLSGERMRDALKKHGKQVEWVLYLGEGHGFSKRQNLLDYWRRVEAFLAKHLE
jgi:dipeptidyl aminopeptidase/acylaminoacyl peptidase